MILPMGDYNTTETVNIPINTFSSDDPSISVTMTEFALGDVKIFKDGSDAERNQTGGVTVDDNFDGNTGAHTIHIDLTNNDHVGFYANGSRYMVLIQGVSVDGGELNAFVATFSIGCILRPTTAGRALDVAAGGEAGVDLGNVTGTLGQANVGWVDGNSRIDVGKWLGQAVTLSSNNKPDINIDEISDDTAAAQNLELMFDGTGYAGGTIRLKANLDQILAAALSEGTGGYLAAAFKKLFDVAVPLLVASDVMVGTDGASTHSAANVRTEMDSNSTQLAAILTKMLKYFRLALRSDSGPTTDDSTELTAINADSGAGGGDYAKEDSQEAIRDQGDSAWITSTLTANAVKTAIEADGGSISSIMEALVYKMIITELNGNTEMFNSAGASQGTVSAAFTSIAGATKREKMVK